MNRTLIVEFDDVLRRAWTDGGLRGRSHVVDGLENAAAAVRINLDGSNRGKVMVRVGARRAGASVHPA